jgi:hypothetical protein
MYALFCTLRLKYLRLSWKWWDKDYLYKILQPLVNRLEVIGFKTSKSYMARLRLRVIEKRLASN